MTFKAKLEFLIVPTGTKFRGSRKYELKRHWKENFRNLHYNATKLILTYDQPVLPGFVIPPHINFVRVALLFKI